MTDKKKIIERLIADARTFPFCGPSDDPDEQTAVTSGYYHLVVQFKRLAGPILPKALASRLQSIEVEIDNIRSAYEARAELDALLPDIESALEVWSARVAKTSRTKTRRSKRKPAEIFISYASADKLLVDALIMLLEGGIGLQSDQIFCTAFEEQGILPGQDFKNAIKMHLERSSIVIALITPRYYQSAFCMCELGATWAWDKRFVPLLVPPINYDVLKGSLRGTQSLAIDDSAKLDAMRDTLAPIVETPQKVSRWNSRKADFVGRIPAIIKLIEASARTDGSQDSRYLDDVERLDGNGNLPKSSIPKL